MVAISDLTDKPITNCPFVASWAEIKDWATPARPPVSVDDYAKAGLSVIHQALSKHDRPGLVGYVELPRSIPEGNNCHMYLNNRVNYVFLRRMHSGDMAGFEQKYRGWQFGKLNAADHERIQAADTSRRIQWPSRTSVRASGTFIPFNDLKPAVQQKGRAPDDFVNWDAVKRGWEAHGGTLGGVWVAASDTKLNEVVHGLSNVSAAFHSALTWNKMSAAMRRKMIPDSWWRAGWEILAGLGITVGVIAGAAAVGAGIGAGVSYFFLPGLSTPEFAVAGASFALALADILMQGMFVVDVTMTAKAEGENFGEGIRLAWGGNVDSGADKIAGVLAAIIKAIMAALLLKLAEKGFSLAKTRLKGDKEVEEWAAREAKARETKASPHQEGVSISKLGFEAKGIVKVTAGSEVQLLETEMAGYKEISKLEGGTCLVVREPSKSRLSWLQRKLQARSKIEKVKAKSLKGKLPPELEPLGGLLALDDIPAANLESTGRKWNPTHPDLANLKGRPIYKVKPGAHIEGIKGDALWKEFAVVDIGAVEGKQKYLIIDMFWEHPMIADVDVAAICPTKGGRILPPNANWLNSHVPEGLQGNIMGTDDAVRGGILNRIMAKHTGDEFYTHFEHSDFGGSAIFQKNGVPVWKEPITNPATQNEGLIMFMNGECHRFENWRVYKKWCVDNGVGFMCPWAIPI